MSKKKKEQRLIKALRKPLPAYLNLVDYIKMRKRVSTSMAHKVLLSGAITVDGKPVGYITYEDLGQEKKMVAPMIPAEWRDRIEITMPDMLKDA